MHLPRDAFATIGILGCVGGPISRGTARNLLFTASLQRLASLPLDSLSDYFPPVYDFPSKTVAKLCSSSTELFESKNQREGRKGRRTMRTVKTRRHVSFLMDLGRAKKEDHHNFSCTVQTGNAFLISVTRRSSRAPFLRMTETSLIFERVFETRASLSNSQHSISRTMNDFPTQRIDAGNFIRNESLTSTNRATKFSS